MKKLLIIVVVILVLIGAYLLFIYSGIYNISAMDPHNHLTYWTMVTTRDNSVKHHAKDIKAPNLSDSVLIRTGFVHYREMCVGCHGAPGASQNEIAEGLYPKPPELVNVIIDWTPSELFWITKNGLKMTGMPAFGRTHSDDMIWAIVAFIEKLPSMNKEQYDALNNSTKNEIDENESQDHENKNHQHEPTDTQHSKHTH